MRAEYREEPCKAALNRGKGMAFAFGMWILPFGFFMILGYGSATYRSTPEELYGV